MGRKAREFNVVFVPGMNLPKDLVEELDNLLFDNEKGRVPGGAYTQFFTALLRKELRESKTKVASLEELANGGNK